MLTEYEKKILKHRKIFFFLLFVTVALYFWPASLYGDSDFILLFGESMLPTIQSGSLVIVKSLPSYDNGDIVAFFNSGGINVVHRIIEVTEGGYVTQGDNNSFKDAPIVHEVIKGKVALVIPYMAYVGLFMQTPIGLAIIAIMFIVMLLPKSKNKSKYISKYKSKYISKYKSKTDLKNFQSIKLTKIVKVALITIGVNYIIEQIAISMNIGVITPLSKFFENSFASTVGFALWIFAFIVISLLAKKIENEEKLGFNPLKLLIFALCILINILI